MSRARLTLALVFLTVATAQPLAAAKPELLYLKGASPLYFEPNVGQAAADVQFVARGARYALFITDRGLTAVIAANGSLDPRERRIRAAGRTPRPVDVATIVMQLSGAPKGARLSGVDQLPGRSNHFLGNDPTQWRTNVPQYAGVRVDEVYRGIDLLYHGGVGELEYDFIVKPGGDPRRIQLHFEGVDSLDVDESGDLLIRVAGREVRQRAPVVYQEIGGIKHFLNGGYVQRFDRDITFRVDRFDPKRPLVIDPVLLYSRYLGGSNDDEGHGITVDASGNTLVVGSTWSANFPTSPGALKTIHADGNEDAYVLKLNPAGAITFATYLGGGVYGADAANAVTIDADGNAYVVGRTDSTDFPIVGAFQPARAGSIDAFVAKLNASGSALLYSTYAGGTVDDIAYAIAIDGQRAMYVAGRTTSSNFAGGGGQPSGSGDAFVLKLTAAGQRVHSKYLGGSDDEEARGIALDLSGNVYVVGETWSTDFPHSANALQAFRTADATSSAFLTQYDPAFDRVYSTYFVGVSSSGANAVTTDGFGFVYFAGYASRTVPFCTCPQFEGSRPFVAKLIPANPVVFSIAVGTPTGLPSDPAPQESATGLAVDPAGYVYVAGETNSDVLYVTNAVQTTRGGSFDAFVSKVRPDGATMAYQTYLGGSNQEWAPKIGIDSSGNAYVIGTTYSSNFPSAAGPFNGGTSDAYHVKIGTSGALPAAPSFSATGQAVNVKLTWGNVSGVNTYIIERATAAGNWRFRTVVLNSGSRTTFDMSVSSYTAYEYRIRSASDDGIGPPSAPDLATVYPATDDPLAVRTTIKAVHMQEVRQAVNAIRTFAGLGPYAYSNTVVPGAIIRASDFSQSQAALNTALAALTLSYYARSYAVGAPVTAADISDLRGRTR